MTATAATPATTATTDRPRSIPVGRVERWINTTVRGLTKLGLSIKGTRVLAVRGRRSGEWRTIVLNPITVDGVRYLVAPRGTTEWVRNLRAAGEGELRVGRRVEAFTATEVADDDKAPILRAYLAAYSSTAGTYFDVDATADDRAFVAAGPDHPVFRTA